MKTVVISVTVLAGLAACIRVPNEWPKPYTNIHKPYPYKYVPRRYSQQRVTSNDGWIPMVPNSVKRVQKYSPSEHEHSYHVPARPVYPGEGQWAVRGHKYVRPYVARPVGPRPPQEPRPDSYDTFLKTKKTFNSAKNKFNREFSKSVKPAYEVKQYHEQTKFVPTKLYTQVRRTEKEVHLPKGSGDDPKLTHVIKDSKIQTVYTEEGYEDGAYDHAGHVKEAETEDEFGTKDNNVEESKSLKKVKKPPMVHKFAILERRKRSEYSDNVSDLDPNSPLRYSEESVPVKEGGHMSFYESRPNVECPEDDVSDPVPDRIKNAEEEDETYDGDEETSAKTRLGKLGDKIDCLKAKYFGEEPLSNPLFREDKIHVAVPHEFQKRQPKDLDSTNEETQAVPSEAVPDNSTAESVALPYKSYNRRQSSNYIRNPMKPGRVRPKNPKRRLQHQRSEVQYKDDIKPSEQLHVLSDILRNIQNSSGELIQTPLPHSPTHRSHNKPRNKHRRRRIKVAPTPPVYTPTTAQDADAILNTDLNLGEIDNEQLTRIRPPLAKIPGSNTNYEALLDSFGSETVHFEDPKPPKKQYPTVYKNHRESTEVFDGYLADEDAPQDVNSENDIIGLVPPSRIEYRTIVQYPGLGKFPVPGMKAPVLGSYLDEVNNLKRNGYAYRRGKRAMKEYTEIRRNTRKPFRFREDGTTEATVQEEEGEEEEEEEEEVATTTVRTTTTTTTQGPPTRSFLEFVADLKGSKNYVPIAEPTTTTTEKSTGTTATPSTTTGKPPEFLSFVSKLKDTETYVAIPEKKPSTSTSTAQPTVVVEDNEEEEDDVQQGPVQNSRTAGPLGNSTSEDTNEEYVPKPKTYSISSIDTSKYKTIERSTGTTPRHALSSRYNSNKDDISSGEMNTARIPVLSRAGSVSESDEVVNVTKASRRRGMWTRSQNSRSTTTAAPERRRGRQRSRPTTTTETVSNVRKRHADAVPKNHKPEYTPIIPRLSSRHLNTIYSVNSKRVEDYEPDDLGKRTVVERPLVVVARYSDIVPKPFSFFSDPALADKVNQLKESKGDDDVDKFQGYEEDEETRVREKKNGFVINVPDTDHVSEIVTERPRVFEKVNQVAQRRSIEWDPSKRLYYYAID